MNKNDKSMVKVSKQSDYQWLEWRMTASADTDTVCKELVVAKHKLFSKAAREQSDGLRDVDLWVDLCAELRHVKPDRGSWDSMLRVAYILRRADKLIAAERARLERIRAGEN